MTKAYCLFMLLPMSIKKISFKCLLVVHWGFLLFHIVVCTEKSDGIIVEITLFQATVRAEIFEGRRFCYCSKFLLSL